MYTKNGTLMTRMVRIFADLYIKIRLNLNHLRAIFIIGSSNGLSDLFLL